MENARNKVRFPDRLVYQDATLCGVAFWHLLPATEAVSREYFCNEFRNTTGKSSLAYRQEMWGQG